MELWNALKNALVNYAKFDGRSNRPDYWYFVLAMVIVGIVLGAINENLRSAWSLATLIPSLSAGARRLTDAGYKRSNLWWLLLPFVGWGIFIYEAAQPSVAASSNN
jgi:uncharacterized membrane protein YhaH (DUF805 family)